MERCPWAKTALYVQYHDTEWGVPVHDDRLLFEFLILEGAQAGLSWETILKKRENYRDAFEGFDPAVVSKFGHKQRTKLLSNAGIVRNRLKIEAAIQNAKMVLALQKEFGTFDRFIWGFVGHKPKQNAWHSIIEVPAKTPESDAMSKDLKRRGLKVCGQHDLLRLHASRGHGERPPGRMLPSRSTVEDGQKAEMKKPVGDPWTVYILRCAGGSVYTGVTKDVKRRCRQHNDGTASRYTRSRRPTKLVWHEAHPSRSSALKREAAIKAMTRREKLAMIRPRKMAG
jgi:DNA-3-methyladenine glycosylase I